MTDLVQLYQQMADHTAPECASTCRKPHSCCAAAFCEQAREYAKREYGVDLVDTGHETLPFMGPDGCVVAPHLRPICTVHTCEISSLGHKRDDPGGEWTKRYFELREAIEEAEWQRIDTKKESGA